MESQRNDGTLPNNASPPPLESTDGSGGVRERRTRNRSSVLINPNFEMLDDGLDDGPNDSPNDGPNDDPNDGPNDSPMPSNQPPPPFESTDGSGSFRERQARNRSSVLITPSLAMLEAARLENEAEIVEEPPDPDIDLVSLTTTSTAPPRVTSGSYKKRNESSRSEISSASNQSAGNLSTGSRRDEKAKAKNKTISTSTPGAYSVNSNPKSLANGQRVAKSGVHNINSKAESKAQKPTKSGHFNNDTKKQLSSRPDRQQSISVVANPEMLRAAEMSALSENPPVQDMTEPSLGHQVSENLDSSTFSVVTAGSSKSRRTPAQLESDFYHTSMEKKSSSDRAPTRQNSPGAVFATPAVITVQTKDNPSTNKKRVVVASSTEGNSSSADAHDHLPSDWDAKFNARSVDVRTVSSSKFSSEKSNQSRLTQNRSRSRWLQNRQERESSANSNGSHAVQRDNDINPHDHAIYAGNQPNPINDPASVLDANVEPSTFDHWAAQDKDSSPRSPCCQRVACIIILSVIVIVSIFLGLTFAGKKTTSNIDVDRSSESPTLSPVSSSVAFEACISSPNLSLKSHYSSLYDTLSIDKSDDVPFSNQRQALCWLLEVDKGPVPESLDDNILYMERYSLVVFFYALRIDGDRMSEDLICAWEGVKCERVSGIDRVSSIILDRQGLEGPIPKEIGNFEYLETLNLGFNKISGSIPNELSDLNNLENLLVPSNNIEGMNISHGSLHRLENLDLKQNKISSDIFDALLELPFLKFVDLSSNRIDHLPEDLGKLSGLEVLYVRSNRISEIPASIGDLSSLVKLNLALNKINGILTPAIGLLLSLEFLRLESNMLSGTIPSHLGNLENLVLLNLADNRFRSTIPTELGRLTKATFLSFYGNDLTGVMPEEICAIETKEHQIDLSSDCGNNEATFPGKELPVEVVCDCCDCCANLEC